MSEYRYYLRGDVDLATAPRVRSDLSIVVAATDSHVLIDCTHLTFIDSTGITALLEAHHNLASEGREMLVANVPPRCRSVFDILGLSDLLTYDRTGAVS